MRQFTVEIKVQSKLAPLIEAHANGDMTAYLSETPQAGKANDDLRALIAKHLDVPVSNVHIMRGLLTGTKVIRVNE